VASSSSQKIGAFIVTFGPNAVLLGISIAFFDNNGNDVSCSGEMTLVESQNEPK